MRARGRDALGEWHRFRVSDRGGTGIQRVAGGRTWPQLSRVNPPPKSLTSALADRYRIDREIGQGGMATVYLARDVKHERDVAIKVLKPELGAVLGVERFLSEIEVTANLQHPHLLPLFDSGEADGLLFYVMPFVEGETLRARLEAEPQLPVEEAIRLITLVAGALDFAHARGSQSDGFAPAVPAGRRPDSLGHRGIAHCAWHAPAA